MLLADISVFLTLILLGVAQYYLYEWLDSIIRSQLTSFVVLKDLLLEVHFALMQHIAFTHFLII